MSVPGLTDALRAAHRSVHLARARIRGFCPVRIDGTRFRCDADHALFWRQVARGRWEPHTFDFLRRYLSPETRYWDIGSWIGPTVLPASRRCREVLCFEPDPFALRYLLANLQSNGIRNAQPFGLALGMRDGLAGLAAHHGELGESMTRLSTAGSVQESLAPVMRIDHFLHDAPLDARDVMKIDIEGGEYELIPAMAHMLAMARPTLHLSFHPYLLGREQRREHTEGLLTSLSFYSTVLDEHLEPLDPTTLFDRYRDRAEGESMDSGFTLVFAT